MWQRRVLALAVVMVAGTACDDSKEAPAAVMLAPQPMESRGVRAYVVQEPGGTANRVTLTIRIQSKDVGVAAYQGRLEFDKDAFEIIEATAPSGDGTRLVNASAAPGLLRFGGFAAEKFAGNTAVTLIVRPIKPLEQANLLASLDVAGEPDGTAIQKPLMPAQKGYYTSVAPE
jgi:hypothetical protein